MRYLAHVKALSPLCDLMVPLAQRPLDTRQVKATQKTEGYSSMLTINLFGCHSWNSRFVDTSLMKRNSNVVCPPSPVSIIDAAAKDGTELSALLLFSSLQEAVDGKCDHFGFRKRRWVIWLIGDCPSRKGAGIEVSSNTKKERTRREREEEKELLEASSRRGKRRAGKERVSE